MTTVTRSRHDRSLSFGSAAAAYERGRPSYPPEAIDWLLPRGARQVLDLGAGTGKLTTRLVERGLDVVAVDPIPDMLEVLRTSLPETRALLGTAEGIPCRTTALMSCWSRRRGIGWIPSAPFPRWPACCGRAGGWAWCGTPATSGWAGCGSWATSSAPTVTGAGSTSRCPSRSPTPERHQVEWTNYLTPQALIDLVASRSYCITSPAEVRTQTLDQVRELLATHPALANSTGLALPYVTVCIRATLSE